MATYADSDECARAGGMKAQSATTYPDTTMIDDYREDAYASIGGWTSMGVADSTNGVLQKWERKLVGRRIMDIRFNRDKEWDLTDAEGMTLQSEFSADGGSVDYGMEFWEPGANT